MCARSQMRLSLPVVCLSSRLRSILAWALEPRLPALDRNAREQNIQSCPFTLQFLESIPFIQKPIKTQKTEKESKIAQCNMTKKLKNVN